MKNNKNRLFVLAMQGIIFASLAQSAVIKQNDGNILLENQVIRAVISPVAGGRIISFCDKRNGLDYTSDDAESGIGSDLNWQQLPTGSCDWFNKPYLSEIISARDKSQVKLSRTGENGSWRRITIEKTYTVEPNNPVLRLDYDIRIHTEAMTDIAFFPWLHNGISVKNYPGVIFLPHSGGIKTISYNSGAPANESFYYDATDGWAGFLVPGKKAGLLIRTDNYQDLMCFYNWQGPQFNTMEMLFRSQRIPCGKSYHAGFDLMPVIEMDRIDGAAAGLSGQFMTNSAGKLDGVRIYSAADNKAKCEISYRKLPSRVANVITAKDIDLQTGITTSIAAQFEPTSDGTYVYQCRIAGADGKTLLDFEMPLVAGTSSEQYAMQPKTKRLGSDQERLGQTILNKEEQKDCYSWTQDLPITGKPWCKPSSTGTIKLLVVTDMFCGREAIELAGRMDADLSACTFSSLGLCGWNHVWGHSGGKMEINTYLGELLKKDYDCILLAGLQMESMTKENMEMIASKVKAGAGLVSVMPSKIPEQYQVLFPARPLIPESFSKISPEIGKSGKIGVAPECFLKAMPFNNLPEVYIFPYAAIGLTALTAGDKPLLCTGSAGKGKTALFSWLSGRPDNTRRCGIAPYFDNPPDFPWHDYYYAMLIKAILWAGNREPPVRIENIEAGKDQTTLVLNGKINTEVEIEITFKHQSGIQLSSEKFTRKIKEGANNIALLHRTVALHGNNFAEIRLGIQGLAADFGVGAFQFNAPLHISAVTLPEKIFTEGENLPVKVGVGGNPQNNARINYRLTDQHGRILWAGVTEIGGKPEISFEAPLRHLYAHQATLELELGDNSGNKFDLVKKEILTAPADLVLREWNNYKVILGWPARANRAFPFYLHEVWRKSIREIGIDTFLHVGIPVTWGRDQNVYGLSYRQGFALEMESLARLSKHAGLPYCDFEPFDYRWREDVFQELREKYNQTLDKKYLERSPTLESASYRKKYQEAMSKWMTNINQWYPAVYDMGDEMSYTLFNYQLDFDFSPESLQAFREWLKTLYPSLDDLNQEWQSQFKGWDQVLPDTAIEARKRNCFSSWSDHRTYNEKVFADFLGFVKETIVRMDPKGKVGISGTEEPRAYNGFDWSRLMPIMDTMNAYDTGGLPEIYPSFKKIPLAGWSGYQQPEKDIWRRIWHNAFNGHFGVAIFNEEVILNPDLTLTPRALWLKAAVMPLKNGIGNLLYDSSRKKPEVAIHYSQPSIHAAWIGQSESQYSDNRVGWLKTMNYLSYNSEFVASAGIEKGSLVEKKYKMLILPMSLAVSAREESEIRKFADKGGMVIADIMPGIYDEHCGKSGPGRMDDLFDGKKGILLNETLEKYDSPEKDRVRQKLQSAMQGKNIPVSQDFLSIDKAKVEINSFVLDDKGSELVGLWAEDPINCHIRQSDGKFIYDVFNGKEINAEQITLPAGKPALFARLPYQVKDLSLRAEKGPHEIKITAQVKADSAAGRHVIRFSVTSPDGKEYSHYSAVHEAPGGTVTHVFYPGLNETEFKVKATDVISGKAQSVTVK